MDEYKELIDHVGGPVGWEKFGKGERHGSHEWTWSPTKDDGIALFVALAITPEQQPSLCGVEIWAGAEDGERFVRHLVAQFSGVKPQTICEEPVKTWIREAVSEGAAHALAFTLGDLTEVRYRIPAGQVKQLGLPTD